MVEVAYALPSQQVILPVKVASGTTAEAAIQASGVLAKFPEIDLAVNKIGLFGKLSQLDTKLRHLGSRREDALAAFIEDFEDFRRRPVSEQAARVCAKKAQKLSEAYLALADHIAASRK